MIKTAIGTLNAKEKPIIHSDRGAHYRRPDWIDIVNQASLIRSMSRKSCSPDNAACEGFLADLRMSFYTIVIGNMFQYLKLSSKLMPTFTGTMKNELKNL